MLCGCQVESELGLTSDSFRRHSVVTIRGHILHAEESRTTIDADGLKIRWTAGDSIGVWTDAGQHCSLALDESSAGSADGLFRGSASGAPLYAYYPYSGAAAVDSFSLSSELPIRQTQRGEGPDMSLDLKVGSFGGWDAANGYSFDFIQKYTLLDFRMTPDAFLAGDRLGYLVLQVPGREMAGRFSLDIGNPYAPLAFPGGASDRVCLDFTDSPVLAAGTPVHGWMYINSAVAAGDSLQMVLVTDRHTVRVGVRAAKDYRMGYRYVMPLDIAALTASGKARVSEGFTDVTLLEDTGIYDCIAGEYTVCYKAGENQYATTSLDGKAQFRVQNLLKGYSYVISVPASLSLGEEVEVSVTSYGSGRTGTDNYKATVKRMEGPLVWLEDVTGAAGFIIIK